MNNDLNSLNNYLFEELERLNDDEELEGEKLDKELKRSKAISGIGMTIVNNAKLILDATKFAGENGYASTNEVLKLKDSSNG